MLSWLVRETSSAISATPLSNGEFLLRLVSHTDAEWEAIFAPCFSVERLAYYAWPGEEDETRRLFFLRRK